MVGMNNAAIWLAKDFNLSSWTSENDGTGWRVLEMIHMVTHGEYLKCLSLLELGKSQLRYVSI